MKQFIIEAIESQQLFDFSSVVIRGNDDQPHLKGDIDVLVSPGNSNIACLHLAKFLKSRGWLIIAFRELDYLSCVVVANTELFPGRSVKIDFFGGLGWYGLNKKEFDFRLLCESDDLMAQSTITLAHKLMYSGVFCQKDIKRVEPFVNRAIKSLNLSDLIDEEILSTTPISKLLKWRVRFRVSGYSKLGLPFWLVRVICRVLKSKVRPTRGYGRAIFLLSSNDIPQFFIDDLTNLYAASGDKDLPLFNHPLLNNLYRFGFLVNDLSSNNRWYCLGLSPVRSLFLVISRSLVGFMTYRGGYFISTYDKVFAPVSSAYGHCIIDLSKVGSDDMFSTVTNKINTLVLRDISDMTLSH